MSSTIRNKISKPERLTYIFPKSEEIQIHRSDLQILLEKFKSRIKESFSIFDGLALVSLWAPVFSAEFKSIFGLNSDAVESGYVVFAVLITIVIFWSRLFRRVIRWLNKEEMDISADAEKMSQGILSQCRGNEYEESVTIRRK